jgi:hypothetical protein
MPPTNLTFTPNRLPAQTSVAVTISGQGLDEVTHVETWQNAQGYRDAVFAFDTAGNMIVRTGEDLRPGQYNMRFSGTWGSDRWTWVAGQIYELDVMPPGRGRWRILLVGRNFQEGGGLRQFEVVAEIMDARSKRLELKLNSAAQFRFSVDGHSETAQSIRELEHEIWVSRWDETLGRDIAMFRGVIAFSQDTLSEQLHTVNYQAVDYLGLLGRRLLTIPYAPRNTDQDLIVSGLLARGTTAARPTANGVSFAPAANMPLAFNRLHPDGSNRSANSGRLRDRDYAPQSNIGDLLDNLATVQDGFDYGAAPAYNDFRFPDMLSVYYPHRGVTREQYAFVFGMTISALSRSVNSSDYANYVRVSGQPDEYGADTPYGEAWLQDINDIVTNPQGFWPTGISASDVVDANTLLEKAAGALLDMSVFKASYSLNVRPGAFRPGDFDIGDQVPLRIRSGRLDVDTYVRVIGMTYGINDDAASDDMEVDVTRGAPSLIDQTRQANSRLSALERR